MKIKATMSVEIEIGRELIIEHENMNNFDIPMLSELSTNDEVAEYFLSNRDDIMSYAKETAIDILAEQCDEVALRGHYEFIDTEEIGD